MDLNLSNEFDNLSYIGADTNIEKSKPIESVSARDYSINSNDQVITIRNKRVSPIVETLTISKVSPSINLNYSEGSIVESKERSIEFDSYIPKKIDNKSIRIVLGLINDEVAKVWRSKTSEYAFDIDIKLEFQKNLENDRYEAIYTVFVPNLREGDIPTVWNNLRKLYDSVIESNKRNQKKYREYFNMLSKMTYIQLDW